MPSADPPQGEENLWTKLLTEVQSRSAASLPSSSILVLGGSECGKTSLIARMQRNDDPLKGSGLEYHYLDVNQDYKDGSYAYQLGSALPDVGPGESTRMGVYILDGDTSYAPLIKYALNDNSLSRCLVLLCASMSEPWTLLDSLQRWGRVLQEHLDSLPNSSTKEARDRQVRFWQEYVEPLDSSSHSDMGAKVPSMEMDHILLPLGNNVLTSNQGVPVVVVITKCDNVNDLEKDMDFKEEHFDFIQQHIRKFCLRIGAALVYTSVKDARNCDTLYKYILHRLYGFAFTQPAMVVEKDSIFIPAGWDNEKKIGILHENLSSVKPDDDYNTFIKKPVLRRAVPNEVELKAEDDQSFLSKQQSTWASQQPPTQQTTNPEPKGSPILSRTAKSPAVLSPTPVPKNKSSGDLQAPGASVPGATNEGVLAQFFNNLLKTKANATGPNNNNVSPNTTLNSSRSFDQSSGDGALTRTMSEVGPQNTSPSSESGSESITQIG